MEIESYLMEIEQKLVEFLSERVYVEVDLEGSVALVLQQLLAGKGQVAAYLGHIEARLELEHELADGEGLDLGNGGLVGTKDTGTEPLAQPAT